MPKYNNQRGVYITGSIKQYIESLETVPPPTKNYFVKIERKNHIFYLDEFGSPCEFSHAMALTEDCANRICNKLRINGYLAHVFSTSTNSKNKV